jgi:hypothetical protein
MLPATILSRHGRTSNVDPVELLRVTMTIPVRWHNLKAHCLIGSKTPPMSYLQKCSFDEISMNTGLFKGLDLEVPKIAEAECCWDK